MMRSLTTTALAAMLAVGLSACDQEVTGAASGRSQMQVAMRGDDASGAASTSPASSARFSLGGGASGSVDVRARVWVETNAGKWVEVTNGVASETVQASGNDGAHLLATAEVDASEYQRVRVEFDRVQADVLGSITIGTSLLSGSVAVNAGSDGKIVVERDVACQARAGATSHIEVNLNAQEWLQRADTETHAVAEAEFQNAVAITAS
jgi:hypothetical protein